MLGLGWSEMLVIGVVVLIVVGPKDLPMMMRNIGRMMGTVRRMSNEFRREIDKAIAADEIREARKAISEPLKQTSQDIAREFNTIKNGKVEPSGKLAPPESGEESVVDAIHAQAGMTPKAEPSAAATALRAKVSETVARPVNGATTTAAAPKPKVKAVPRNGGTTTARTKAAAKPKTAKTTMTKAATTTAKAADSKPAAKPAAKKATAKKAAPARAENPADAGREG